MNLIPFRNKRKSESHEVSTPTRWGAMDVESAFDRFFSHPWSFGNGDVFSLGAWVPPVDITETEAELRIRAEIPGVDAKNLSITVSGDVLTLSGEKSESSEKKHESYYRAERRFGSFHRSIQLPEGVDHEKVNAEYADGVLTVTLRRRSDKNVKRIPISLKK